MKDHSLWDEPELKRAIHTFQAIMYSIQVRKECLIVLLLKK